MDLALTLDYCSQADGQKGHHQLPRWDVIPLSAEFGGIVVCIFARHAAKTDVLFLAWQGDVGDWLLVQTAVSVAGCLVFNKA
jgi:hypothetical protein